MPLAQRDLMLKSSHYSIVLDHTDGAHVFGNFMRCHEGVVVAGTGCIHLQISAD